jgi:hypothetical protein
MMRISLKNIFLFFIFLQSSIANASDLNTQGKDFWVSFLPNWPNSTPKLEILIAGQRPCTGTATNPKTGWSTSFSVTPGVVTSVVIPNNEGLMDKENKVEHKAIHVTTTDDVSLYASNFFTQSYDVCNVLPTAILADNYIAQSYDVGFTAAQGPLYSKMLIVATENGTKITVDPKGGLKGVFPPFKKKEIKLNAGECYMFISAGGDISGTSVNVKNGKKVAVFSGGDTQIPYNGCCYDAVFEQCVPLAYWGRHFVVTASAMRTKDVVRITSLSQGCRISVDGKFKKKLGAKQFYEFKLDGTKKEAVYISASSPVSVCVYLTSASMGGIMGDPSMVYINPIEQQMDKVTFGSYNTAVSKYHFVNIVTQTNQVHGMTLDSVSIASEFKPVPKKKELSYARVSIAHGSHTLESTNGGFVAHIYGLGEYESYAYTIGANSKVLNQFDEEGNLIVSNIPDEIEGIEDTTDIATNGKTPLTYSHTDTLPTVSIAGLTIEKIKRGEKANGVINNSKNLVINPERYDISAESDYDYLFDSIEVDVEGDSISLILHPRSEWCDCFVPKRLKASVILVPKSDEGGDARRIIIPVVIPVIKDHSWLENCLWVLLLLGTLLLFILYLLFLMRKCRFKKNATITPTYYDHYGNRREAGKIYLRKEGFGHWFARWFLPSDECSTLIFDKPTTSIRFIASNSQDVVNIPRDNIDTTKIRISGYNPKGDNFSKDPIKLVNHGRIYVQKSNGTDDGYLTFNSGETSDGTGYRLFFSLLIFAAAAIILVLLVMMIRGLL